MGEKQKYAVTTAGYFITTILFVGFAIVALVEGVAIQFMGIVYPAFGFYVATILLVAISYISFKKARHMLGVLQTSGA